MMLAVDDAGALEMDFTLMMAGFEFEDVWAERRIVLAHDMERPSGDWLTFLATHDGCASSTPPGRSSSGLRGYFAVGAGGFVPSAA